MTVFPAAPKMNPLPISNHEERHHGKHPEHHVINCSRHTISGCEVLSNRQAANPEDKPEFRGMLLRRLNACSNPMCVRKSFASTSPEFCGSNQ